MIALHSDVRVYLACGYTDMRKGMQGLAMLVQQVLAEDPFNGALYAFRGRRGNLEDPSMWQDLTGEKKPDPRVAAEEARRKKAEAEKPKVVVDVYRGDKHVQESFR